MQKPREAWPLQNAYYAFRSRSVPWAASPSTYHGRTISPRSNAGGLQSDAALFAGPSAAPPACSVPVSHVAPFLTLCNPSTLAEKLAISAPLQSPSRVHGRASSRPPCSHVYQLRPSTNCYKFSDNGNVGPTSLAPCPGRIPFSAHTGMPEASPPSCAPQGLSRWPQGHRRPSSR